MTYDEAVALKTFDTYCTCGGHTVFFNGRDPRHPHQSWCPQLEQWEAWRAALDSGPPAAGVSGGRGARHARRRSPPRRDPGILLRVHKGPQYVADEQD